MRTIRGALDRLLLHWEAGLRRLPFFTQRTAVVLLGVLVATREHRPGMPDAHAAGLPELQGTRMRRRCPAGVPAMVGGVVALVGWPGTNGPAHLVPGERAGQAPESRPEPGDRPAPGSSGAGVRSGADPGGATAASPSPADAARSAPTGGAGADRAAPGTVHPGTETSGGTASGAQGSGGAAGAGAGGPPAAPPTTSPTAASPPPRTSPPTTTTRPGPLDPVDELLGQVVSTLLP